MQNFLNIKVKVMLPLCILAGLAQWTLAGNPVIRGADPHAMYWNKTIYIYPTSGPRTKFYVYTSDDLKHWQRRDAILNFEQISWIPKGKSAWAPSIIEKDARWFFYYSVGPKPSHIGVASGDSPLGPFTDSNQPLLSDNSDPTFEAIDPMVFKDPKTDTYYLYAGGSAGARLRVFELADDLLHIKQEIDVQTPQNFTEGVFMHERSGIYYLSYSHGGWQTETYSVHYATAPSPIGPWQYQGVLLSSDDNYKGPGHHSFVHLPNSDQWLIVYHRWENVTGPGPYKGHRLTAIETVKYEPNGKIKPVRMTRKGVTLTPDS